jgi:hypothetical protein
VLRPDVGTGPSTTKDREGSAGSAGCAGSARDGYTDLSVTIDDLIEGSDRVAARITWSGRRPSGEPVLRETVDIVRVEAGRAVEHWGGQS